MKYHRVKADRTHPKPEPISPARAFLDEKIAEIRKQPRKATPKPVATRKAAPARRKPAPVDPQLKSEILAKAATMPRRPRPATVVTVDRTPFRTLPPKATFAAPPAYVSDGFAPKEPNVGLVPKGSR